MAAVSLTILGQSLSVEATPEQARRLSDLARALEARLPGFTGDSEGLRRLLLTALAMMDETQAARAALARAHEEIERLTDLIEESQPRPQLDQSGAPRQAGRLTALSRAIGMA